MGRSRRWWIPVLVLALLAGWWWRHASSVGEGVIGTGLVAEPEAAAPTHPAPRATATPTRVLPGGYVGPDLASLSPVEREALRNAEVERSAAAAPPRTFKDIDGRQRAFRYPDPVAAESAERLRQARRDQLMLELEADPARFARTHRLSLKQVQWIVDGETDFPDRLLDPP